MIILPTMKEVHFTINAFPEHTEIKNNYIVSVDAEFDKKCEKAIIKGLNNGNEWAWCTVEVKAHWTDESWNEFTGADYLGCCSYKDKQSFISEIDRLNDMKQSAFEELIDNISNNRISTN